MLCRLPLKLSFASDVCWIIDEEANTCSVIMFMYCSTYIIHAYAFPKTVIIIIRDTESLTLFSRLKNYELEVVSTVIFRSAFYCLTIDFHDLMKSFNNFTGQQLKWFTYEIMLIQPISYCWIRSWYLFCSIKPDFNKKNQYLQIFNISSRVVQQMRLPHVTVLTWLFHIKEY